MLGKTSTFLSLFNGVDIALVAEELVEPGQNVNLFEDCGKKRDRLKRGVSVADNGYFFVLIERAVADSAVINAFAEQFFLVCDSYMLFALRPSL